MMRPRRLRKSTLILFVCKANQIRSPFAAAYFRKLLEEKALDNGRWEIDSAGTWAQEGHAVSSKINHLASKWGVNLRPHRSKPISAKLVKRADLIVTMEGGQKEALCHEFPEARDKIIILPELKGKSYDITDPIGHQDRAVINVFTEISYLLKNENEKLLAMARKNGR